MDSVSRQGVAVVGLGAILPDAMTVTAFWENLLKKRYSITDVPPDRWSVADYYDPDPDALNKTYCKIGGWVQGFEFNWKDYRIPPKVAAAMDESQKWALATATQALADFGYPQRPLDLERTGVILGTAMGGEMHYLTYQRLSFQEFARTINGVKPFQQLPVEVRQSILKDWQEAIDRALPPVTEDSMPGELPNVVSGRVANVLNLRGPNFITDAACASSLAAVQVAIELLKKRQMDAVVTGGVDHNMGASTFIKFSKIGALSATGSRPFGAGADGFVMGEGAGVFLLKRLEDAERDGDTIYAVIRGVGGASDGKGKGITAPNPIGQQLAIQRAWQDAGVDPTTATLIEAHGTSTRVGDVAEMESLTAVFGAAPCRSIGLGSVKSNIGHLKAGAGAAGLLKTILALHHKILPPTLNAEKPNPNIEFDRTPFYLNHEPREWKAPAKGLPRRAGVSAFGFGGTNFHLVLEEHIPGLLTQQNKVYSGVSLKTEDSEPEKTDSSAVSSPQKPKPPKPSRGILAVGGDSLEELKEKLDELHQHIRAGWTVPLALPEPADLKAQERLVIDFGDHNELLDRVEKSQKAFGSGKPEIWAVLQAQGIFRGSGPKPGKVAFLFPGQGSQYLNMGRKLVDLYPAMAQVVADADQVMTPILGKPLSQYIYIDDPDPTVQQMAERNLMQTAITQPAMLTLDVALFRLLSDYGFKPDMVMGHSLGEYAALIAAGVMPFADALEAAAARGREMTAFSVEDNGWMAAVMAPYEIIQKTLTEVNGYVVAANINSYNQCVIGGASQAVEQAIQVFQEKGFQAMRIPVSHAFHTRIVAPASVPLRQVLDRLNISSPKLPLVANVTGDFYPTTPEAIKDILQQQVASPVQWLRGLETLYDAGVRTFVEVGPKKAVKGFVDDVLGKKPGTVSLFTNHPKVGELVSFNHALCGLYAAGYGMETQAQKLEIGATKMETRDQRVEIQGPAAAPLNNGFKAEANLGSPAPATPLQAKPERNGSGAMEEAFQQILGQLASAISGIQSPQVKPYDRNEAPLGSVVISGTGLGLPGAEKSVMDPDNASRILRGEQFIDLIPERFRKRIMDKQITRLIKAEDGNGSFEVVGDPDQVIKLAGRPGSFDLSEEYGVPEKLVESLDITSQLAMAAGLDALREAGIPLVQIYRQTKTGKYLPDRWMLPECMRDETGVIFASAFPGGDRLADEFTRYYSWQNRLSQLAALEDLFAYTTDSDTQREIQRRIVDLRGLLEREPYEFDRQFLFRVLSMGHSQFAEYIGARGPNTQINAACASTAQAVSIAEDWIRSGRCRRVVVVAGDNVTSNNLMEWVGAGFLSLGAAAIEDRVEEAALPFDRRRHGTILGMGACALVVESEDAVRERGMRGIVELLSSETRNSAYHGSRLDVEHISAVMEALVDSAERRFGMHRAIIASQLAFMSHETFTPARGGSASAEIVALRHTFGEAANEIIIANTKGFTGHAMGVGVEDVIAVKILEYGIVPPVPNFKEVDNELGPLNLSRGGRYPVQFALHLAAGFGSQIAMTLVRRIPGNLNRVDNQPVYQHWLDLVSGYSNAVTEVVKRVLRVKAQECLPQNPAPNTWTYGTGPMVRSPGSVSAGTIAEMPKRRAPASPAEPKQAAPNPPLPGKPVLPPDKWEQVVRVAPEPEPIFIAPPRAPVASEPTPAPHSVQMMEGIPPAVTSSKQETAAQQTPIQPPADAIASTGPVAEAVLSLVAEKTGYPKEMLAMDLDLEADLGIDTVKQAEVFLSIRETFDIPRQENLRLRNYPTLGHVIRFVQDMRPDLVACPQEPPIHPTNETTTQPTTEPNIQSANQPVSEPTTQPTSQQAQPSDPIAEKVLDLVAEKTGYPVEMLELDLDMEADLGIDTVKQAETFLAIRETFDIPRQESLRLRDYPSLGHVIQFVKQMRPDLQPGAPLSADETTSQPANLPTNQRNSQPTEPLPFPDLQVSLAAADRLPRRIPVPILRPVLEMCKPTSVQLDEHSRVLVMLDQNGVGKALVRSLQERRVQVLALPATLPAADLEAQLKAFQESGPVHGVYWLPALDGEPCLEDMDLETWRELNRQRVKNLHAAMRCLYVSIQTPNTFLVSATRLGGLHSYDPVVEAASAPGSSTRAAALLGGAVTGFIKAYKRERDQALVKAVDFEMGPKPGLTDAVISDLLVAERLIAETLRDPDVVEVGLREHQRYAISLVERPAAGSNPLMTLDAKTVFMITGAAGGITSAIVADLAGASRGTFYLLDLAPLPAADDPHICLFRSDKAALKENLAQEIKASGERATPAKIEKQISAIERSEAALRAVEAVAAAGGTAYYHSLDLLNGEAVQSVIEEIRHRNGRIDVLIHAAGIEISRSLPDKDAEQFNRVFDVKTDGFFNVLRAAKGLPLGTVLVFSSVAARFGNAGQTDYSAANDLLCKLTQGLGNWRPGTRGIAIDWTAWGEIGMATRGSIPKLMKMAGIEMLPSEVGIPTVRRELLYNPGGEVVIAGELGILSQKWDETEGPDLERATGWLSARRPQLLMLGRVKSAGLHSGWLVETTLDPKVQPFLYDHAMDGTPLLPGVMGTEAFVELAFAAASALGPDYHVTRIEHETFHNPFKFYHMEPQTLHLSAQTERVGEGELLVHTVMKSRRELPSAKGDGVEVKEKVHFTAEVRLTCSPATQPVIDFPVPSEEALNIRADSIYQIYFHGPAYQVLEAAQVQGDRAVGRLAANLPPDTSPSDAAKLIAPRLLELCFQTSGIWEIQTHGGLALPLSFDSLEIFRLPDPDSASRLYALVQAQKGGERFNAQVVDESGAVYLELKGYATVRLPGSQSWKIGDK